jgi:hypothetical protein
MTQDEIDPGSTEATASSKGGGGSFGDKVTVHQTLPAGSHDDGEMHRPEGHDTEQSIHRYAAAAAAQQ